MEKVHGLDRLEVLLHPLQLLFDIGFGSAKTSPRFRDVSLEYGVLGTSSRFFVLRAADKSS
ncbi:hypothetical protein [Pandoraea communis]|uniref:hypothetical protein n=1 Tax=Pandoraea communis TaxID=2508297 RepID=UPI00123F8593|nr:hypothetical protein [Pandoraea communis]MDM8354758.1 hypothetical protein [Pandoraea communis]